MTDLDWAYKAKDEAEAELEALRVKEQACMDAIRDAVNAFAEQCGEMNMRHWILDDMAELVGSIAEDTRDGIASRLSKARGDLETLEAIDLQKSAVR